MFIEMLDDLDEAYSRLSNYDGHKTWTKGSPYNSKRSGADWDDEPRKVSGYEKLNMDKVNTIKKFLEKKPFKKFTMKQVEVIINAIFGDDKDNRLQAIARGKAIDKIKSFIEDSKWHDTYFGGYAEKDLACYEAIYKPEGYLALGYYLTHEYSFLKSDKIFTVYVEKEDLEKYFGITIE